MGKRELAAASVSARGQRLRSVARRLALVLLPLAPACGGGGGSNGNGGGCPGELFATGFATPYTYTPGSGQCSFTGDDSDPMVAAAGSADFNGSELCGQYVHVTGPLGSVDVRIVDLCPGCVAGDLDLNGPAYAVIGPAAGPAPITWHTIPDPTGGNVAYHVGAGSNPFFLQVQPRHGRYGIASLEYLAPSGFVAVPREAYDYFTVTPGAVGQASLSDPFTVRITDVNGATLVQSGIPLTPDTTFAGSSQFPACE